MTTSISIYALCFGSNVKTPCQLTAPERQRRKKNQNKKSSSTNTLAGRSQSLLYGLQSTRGSKEWGSWSLLHHSATSRRPTYSPLQLYLSQTNLGHRAPLTLQHIYDVNVCYFHVSGMYYLPRCTKFGGGLLRAAPGPMPSFCVYFYGPRIVTWIVTLAA